jgi:hypothetical protein
MDIKGIDKAKLTKALYDNAGSGGGMAKYKFVTGDMQLDDAAKLFAQFKGNFDYINGRAIKVRISGDELERAHLYDRDHGAGACAAIIAHLRSDNA